MTFSANNFLKHLKSNQWFILGFLFIISLLISIQNISLGVNNFWEGHYTHYNNFLIFKNSFSHLIENKNLYDYYRQEYADLYKYSPTFALFMGFFYYLPDSIGLIIWNSLNVFVLYYAVFSLKSLNASGKLLLILFLLFELITSTQNSQSNALLAGLTIITFTMLENGKNTQASFFIVLGTFIKLYSIVGCLLFLFYPNKIKSLLTLAMWSALFFLLPLLFIDLSDILWQYKNWYTLLLKPEQASIGISVFAFTQLVLPLNYFKSITLLFGVLIVLIPLCKIKHFSNQWFRLQYLSLILIWMVVFNYKAESPTYVIAMSGIGIWFFTSKQSYVNTILIVLALLFTSIWVTDLVPHSLRTNFIDIKFVKSFFPILILLKLCIDIIFKPRLCNRIRYESENSNKI